MLKKFVTATLRRATGARAMKRICHFSRTDPFMRRWLGLDHKEAVEQTELVKQAEKIAPAVKETPGQKLRWEIAQRRPQQHSQRRSGGMHV